MQVDKIVYEASNFRAPSPWDKFSASPSPRAEGLEIEMRRSDGIPKLAPEIEQGNVEYKLILKNPTPERLHRLVTQLNWRLMEGNGQAYYQLGVADSGELVGLTKDEMEATLETLENMAGELGASVLISREIEVRGRLSGLALESVNGMGGEKDMNGSPLSLSTSVTSAEASATDTDTSDADATDATDDTAADSPTASDIRNEGDPNEIIVRSAPVPITHSFLRRTKERSSAPRKWQKEKTLKPEDFLAPQEPIDGFTSFNTTDDDADDEDPQFGVFNLSDLQSQLSSDSPGQLDPARPPRSKMPKPSKGPKAPRQPKGAKPPSTIATPKTPEQIAQKLADKRAKRDKRREERAKALMDPVYDHGELVTQDGVEGKIDYEKIVAEDAEPTVNVESPPEMGMISSMVTLKQEDISNGWPGTSLTPSLSSQLENPAIVDLTEDDANLLSPSAAEARGEPRLIVEALVVRKAGFGRGFVDLSQFDEELRHLPSFSLS